MDDDKRKIQKSWYLLKKLSLQFAEVVAKDCRCHKSNRSYMPTTSNNLGISCLPEETLMAEYNPINIKYRWTMY